jgi:predicted Zn-dependent peptidase
VERNIKRLLTMVESPYFTKETVDKEKGIILISSAMMPFSLSTVSLVK